MAGYKSKSVLKGGASNGTLVVGASASQAVSDLVPVRTGGNLYAIVDINVTAVTSATGITLKVQDSPDGTNWFDKKTLAVTTTGWKTISFNNWASGDQTYLPLRALARLYVTTGSGDSITLTDVLWTQEHGG